MRKAQIGSLEVSVIGLGCNNFGRGLDAAQTAGVVGAALEAGVTYFDTASNYGEGRSESYLGAALGHHRREVVIGTKFGVPVPGVPGSGGARPGYVRQAIERSLARLGTDFVDLYQLHFPDPETPIEDTLAVLHELREEGKVREIGCCNLDVSQLTEALGVSAGRGLKAFVSNQVEYSLIHREPETNGLSQVCEKEGIALLPFYPLASGLLSGKTRRGERPKGRLRMDRYRRYLTDQNFDFVERLEGYANDRGVTMVQVAIGWLLSHDVVPSVTAGATSREQIARNATAAEWSPSPSDLEALEAILDPVAD
jgi:aryl-alcohol dehydrogenase-like predicted oxidoreductase